jgi:DNA-binding MltR family transcriptional regulator
MPREMLMVDLDVSVGVKDLIERIRHQSRMTHSSIVLASAAILDSQLERVLKKAMKPLPEKFYRRLFQSFGPLSDFASKILMARALGIITVEVYDELEKLRHIRNAFAHSSKILTFESMEIASKLSALRKRNTTKTSPSELFVNCVVVIYGFLEAYLVSMGGPPQEKRKNPA